MPVFVGDSLREGAWQREDLVSKVNNKYLDRGKRKKDAAILCQGGGDAVRGLCLGSCERIHDGTSQRKAGHPL